MNSSTEFDNESENHNKSVDVEYSSFSYIPIQDPIHSESHQFDDLFTYPPTLKATIEMLTDSSFLPEEDLSTCLPKSSSFSFSTHHNSENYRCSSPIIFEPRETDEDELEEFQEIVDSAIESAISVARVNPEESLASSCSHSNTNKINKTIRMQTLMSFIVKEVDECVEEIEKLYIRSSNNGLPIYIYNVKDVWTECIGFHATLDWHTYINIYQCCKEVFYVISRIQSVCIKFHQITNSNCIINGVMLKKAYGLLEELSKEKEALSESVQILGDKLKQALEGQSELVPTSSNVLPIENNDKGFKWISDIIDCYLKLKGPLPCTCRQMMEYFRDHHEKLEDEEFFTLTFHIEYSLGCHSLEYIITNLERFVRGSYPILPGKVRQTLILTY